jgi:lipopolysaccharide transport system ATP-binding protein
MKPIIEVNHISKKYRIGEKQSYYSFRDTLTDLAKSPFRKKSNKSEFWALKDISFKVMPGEVIGIIGRNGAGKSTLLKILSRITPPTTGEVILRGRVASLLEVGTGFHPELTGRENIYLNGAVLGMKRAEINNKFDEIVEFAEISKFLDTPVKFYSSGMYMRLAFAIAAHLEPEILLVDEVLAVGDVEFQKKCLGKMKEVSKQGRTVLFVSHNMQAIQSLCKNTILLKNGEINDFGPTDKVVNKYLNTGLGNMTMKTWNNMKNAPGNQFIRIKSAKIIDFSNNKNSLFTVKTPLQIEFEFWNLAPAKINLSLVLWSIAGECIFNVGSDSKSLEKGLYKSICKIPADLLNDNAYSIHLFFVKDMSIGIYNHENILSFEVQDVEREGNWYGKWIGAVRPKLEFNIEEK